MEGWEGVQRQGQDIADRFSSLAQHLSSVLQSHLRLSELSPHSSSPSPSSSSSPSFETQSDRANNQATARPFPWPWMAKPQRRPNSSPCNRVRFTHSRKDHGFIDQAAETSSFIQPSIGIQELGQRIGQAGSEFAACVSGLLEHVLQQLPRPFQADTFALNFQSFSGEASVGSSVHADWTDDSNSGTAGNRLQNGGRKNQNTRRVDDVLQFEEEALSSELLDTSTEDHFALLAKTNGQLHKQGSINVTTTFNSRTHEVESSVVARGDLWRAEASHGGNASANGPLFLLQIGPILFVRDTTLLLPVHISKQHLLWYGFDRKNGLHSLCPAIWSKHRRWLLMSMICINPFTCSFMDLQFPNGQLTYVAGEGLTSSIFVPAFGGLLQAQTRQPGDTKLSFSRKMKWGTHITPSLLLPEKSFSVGVVQPLAWQRSGLMVRPTVQLSVTPTFGGRNMGWRAEVIHWPQEKLSWSVGCALTIQPSAFASVSLGKSKWNGSHSGTSGLVLQVEAPLENINRASFSVQLNSGIDF